MISITCEPYILAYSYISFIFLRKKNHCMCFCNSGKGIQLCKWRDENIWVIPGGRVEPGETIEETAHRELLEETGATLKNLEVLCYIHCFMFNLEYWGIAYFGEIEALGNPLDLNEVSESKLFSSFPENPCNKSGPFKNENKALYCAASDILSTANIDVT